jgi:hypothetical protein
MGRRGKKRRLSQNALLVVEQFDMLTVSLVETTSVNQTIIRFDRLSVRIILAF